MRRKPGALVPLEQKILATAATLEEQGHPEFYGYQLAIAMDRNKAPWRATGQGTLYRALARLEGMGRLESRWEEPVDIGRVRRPPRRLYRRTRTLA